MRHCCRLSVGKAEQAVRAEEYSKAGMRLFVHLRMFAKIVSVKAVIVKEATKRKRAVRAEHFVEG
jgi:hypothetical protein